MAACRTPNELHCGVKHQDQTESGKHMVEVVAAIQFSHNDDLNRQSDQCG